MNWVERMMGNCNQEVIIERAYYLSVCIASGYKTTCRYNTHTFGAKILQNHVVSL